MSPIMFGVLHIARRKFLATQRVVQCVEVSEHDFLQCHYIDTTRVFAQCGACEFEATMAIQNIDR